MHSWGEPVDSDNPWEVDTVENIAQFVQIMVTTALWGTAMILRNVKDRML
jgi:hypothetical protein